MHQNQSSRSEELWDKCLSELCGIWRRQRSNAAALTLQEQNNEEYEALLAQACSADFVRQAWHMNWFISCYRFGAGGILEGTLAGGTGDEVTASIDRRICLGNAILSDTGFYLGRYPEGLLQWLLLVSLGRKEDTHAWGHFLFESREGGASCSDYSGLPLDEYCRFLWCLLKGRDHKFEPNGGSSYSGVLRAWGQGPEMALELRRMMDAHLRDTMKLDGAEVFYLSPFNLCPVEVLAALRILGDEEVELQVAGHPLYRNPVVSAVMASKGTTHDGLRLRDWLVCKGNR